MTNHISQTGPYNANRWGITRATVENGRIVSLSPIAEDAAPSPLLDRLAALPFNPQRIRRPAVRRGYLTPLAKVEAQMTLSKLTGIPHSHLPPKRFVKRTTNMVRSLSGVMPTGG